MTFARLLGGACALAVLLGCGSKPASSDPSKPASTQQAKADLPEPEYFVPDPKSTVALTGRVTFQGPKPARKKLRIDEDPVCVAMNRGGLLDEAVIVSAGGGALANTFVYIRSGLEGKRFRTPDPELAVTIDQKGCRFEPHMIGVRTGQKVRVTNSDPLTHNIHPQPRENREWNQSQEQGAAALERKFVRPEMMIRVKCNVHSWMRAWVNVMDHPYFAVTDPTGAFEIRDVPPGDYVVEAWQEKLGRKEARVHIAAPAAGGEIAVAVKPLSFVFTAADVRE